MRTIKRAHKVKVNGVQYDSKMEHTLDVGLLKEWDFHSMRVPYVIKKNYEVDFSRVIEGVTYLVEAKGVFWDSTVAQKYKHLVQQLPPDTEFIFLFQNASAYLPWSKKRKDGTRMTHAQWCDKNHIVWYDLVSKPIPK